MFEQRASIQSSLCRAHGLSRYCSTSGFGPHPPPVGYFSKSLCVRFHLQARPKQERARARFEPKVVGLVAVCCLLATETWRYAFSKALISLFKSYVRRKRCPHSACDRKDPSLTPPVQLRDEHEPDASIKEKGAKSAYTFGNERREPQA